MSSTKSTTLVERVLSGITNETFAKVARGVLNDDSARITAAPLLQEITTSHNDQRTLAIIKVSGMATANGDQKSWSSVVKIIDTTAESGQAARWAFPETELKVYELGLFAGDGLSLRPARCYLSQLVENRFSILWLEDLSGAPQPPWSPEHFINTANHLGQFNGFHATNNANLPVDATRNAFYVRGKDRDRVNEATELLTARDDKYIRLAYGNTPVESAMELAVLFDQVLEHAKSLPAGLAFGDSHSRNMFPLGTTTVGIDWACLAYDPIGCDVGVLAGSPLTFGLGEARQSVQIERAIFDSYIEGLISTGWAGDVKDVRMAFFAQFLTYLCGLATAPVWIFKNPERRSFIEHRLGARLEEIPEQISPSIGRIPKYVDELKALLA